MVWLYGILARLYSKLARLYGILARLYGILARLYGILARLYGILGRRRNFKRIDFTGRENTRMLCFKYDSYFMFFRVCSNSDSLLKPH